MKASPFVALTVVLPFSVCMLDFASAQGVGGQRSSGFSMTEGLMRGTMSGNDGQEEDDRYGSPRSGQRSISSASSSRSASFMKNGKNVSVAESDAGITVSIDGKRVRAKDVLELKKKYPDAYRMYDEGLRKTSISSGGFARGSSQASGGGGAQPTNSSSSKNQSISVMDNGRKVSIVQNRAGITVSVNGKRVRAKNVVELKKRSPEAFALYEKHTNGSSGPDRQLDATSLMEEELRKLRDKNADNPQVRNLIDRMMQNIVR